MSFFDVIDSIEAVIRKIAAYKRLNKGELSKQSRELIELASYRKQFPDEAFIERIIVDMPESDFCKITEIKDCEVGPAQACTGVKVMVFGNDDVNGKLCEKFTVHVVETSCNDGNFALASQCVATSVSDSCDAILIAAKSARILEAEIVKVNSKLTAVDGKVGVADNKLGQLPILATIAQLQAKSIEEVIAENNLLREQIRTLSDLVDSHEIFRKFICSAFDLSNLKEQAHEPYGVICPTDWHDEL